MERCAKLHVRVFGCEGGMWREGVCRARRFMRIGAAVDVVNWSVSTGVFECVDAEVLQIRDCGGAWGVNREGERAEVVASNSNAGDPGFMEALITELKAGRMMTAAYLHGRLVRSRERLGMDTMPFYAKRQTVNPGSCVFVPTRQDAKKTNPIPNEDGTTRILAGLHVDEIIDAQDMKRWLATLDLPKGLEIEMSGVFGKYVQFTLPVEVWTQLTSREAWRYVGVVERGNELMRGRLPVRSRR